MEIRNDITNTLGFFGYDGIGAGKHSLREFVSSLSFGKLITALNKFSWITAYTEESEESHISYYYGSVVFRDVSSTMSALLDSSVSNYGIYLDYDTVDATNTADIFDTVENVFKIPLVNDSMIGDSPPYFRVEGRYTDSTLNMFRPAFMGYCCLPSHSIAVALFNCLDGTQFTSTDYSALNDYGLTLGIFGYRPVSQEDI